MQKYWTPIVYREKLYVYLQFMNHLTNSYEIQYEKQKYLHFMDILKQLKYLEIRLFSHLTFSDMILCFFVGFP